MKTIIDGKTASGSISAECKKSISNLQKGEVLAVLVRHVNSKDPALEKVQAEFAEKINLSTAPTNALAMFNPEDDRFSSGARRVWVTMDRKAAESFFGVVVPDSGMIEINKKVKPLNNGTQDFRIRITEILESQMTEAQKEYEENYIKTIPSTGAFFYCKRTGERVASSTSLVIVDRNADGTKGDPKHVLIEGEYSVLGAKSVLEQAATSKPLSKDLVS